MHLLEVALAALGGAVVGAYATISVARWQIEADNAHIRAAAYRDLLRLAIPTRIERSLAATVFNLVGKEVPDQAEVEAWRKEIDEVSGALLAVASDDVKTALEGFLTGLARENARVDRTMTECFNDGYDDWIAQQEGRKVVEQRAWTPERERLIEAVRADVRPRRSRLGL
jgi:hypothetical protein